MIRTAVKSKTPLHEIIDRELADAGQPPLATIVRKQRKAGTPWRAIADEVRDLIGHEVNWQAIRNWFPKIK